ncbi:MAG: ribosome maturation factor RimP [Endomicrobium sp.]|jgi:ribosome maturation factor RimP|nr:ribosome maturation factor RimP [Endomicrobium sp.]
MTKAQEIEKLLEPIALKERIEIVDVQYVKENDKWVVRIFIDKDGGVKISDCENMSGVFSEILDESDVLKDSYVLEISSPGLNRILKKEESFKRFAGSRIRVRTNNLINNQQNFLGKLLSCETGKIKMDDVTSGIVEIKLLDIKKANVETDI